ncbi:variable surface protein, partial [Plasmodium gonderi]
KNEELKASTYEKITKEALNELDPYMRSYMHRYTKRKGLGKFDCLCEKKIFDIIDKIDKSGKCNKKKLKKNVHLKYGFGFFTTCLVPLFGVILPVLDKICKYGCTNSQNDSILKASGIPVLVYYIYVIFFLILSYIILIFIFYIIIKIVKYEKLKAMKGKMNFNVYCVFFREVFSK